MTPRNRNRAGLILIVLLFAAPLVAAIVLHVSGWRPQDTRNYGELVEPPQDLSAARFVLAGGTNLAWKDAEWSWTAFVLTGPGCAEKCIERIDELRRVRVSLNQNAHRMRIVVLDDTLAPTALAALAPVQAGRDVDARLLRFWPTGADEVAVAFVDPHGFLALHYPVGYDASELRKDLAKLVKR